MPRNRAPSEDEDSFSQDIKKIIDSRDIAKIKMIVSAFKVSANELKKE